MAKRFQNNQPRSTLGYKNQKITNSPRTSVASNSWRTNASHGNSWRTNVPQPNDQNLQAAQAVEKIQQQLSQQLPFRRAYYKTLKKGSLMFANYLFWQHDPSPLVIVTDVLGDRIKGINLHYLTFKYIKSLLSEYCGKSFFGYRLVKHDAYIINAFRTYKKTGLRNIQLLDCDVINSQFQQQRRAYKYNPQEIKAIKEQLRRQLSQLTHPKANELSDRYSQMLTNQDGLQQLSNELRQDNSQNFQPNQSTINSEEA